jgi:hypothetical protein
MIRSSSLRCSLLAAGRQLARERCRGLRTAAGLCCASVT